MSLQTLRKMKGHTKNFTDMVHSEGTDLAVNSEHWTDELRRCAMDTYGSEVALEESMTLCRLESASRAARLDRDLTRHICKRELR